jgi:hypothetical protein
MDIQQDHPRSMMQHGVDARVDVVGLGDHVDRR